MAGRKAESPGAAGLTFPSIPISSVVKTTLRLAGLTHFCIRNIYQDGG